MQPSTNPSESPSLSAKPRFVQTLHLCNLSRYHLYRSSLTPGLVSLLRQSQCDAFRLPVVFWCTQRISKQYPIDSTFVCSFFKREYLMLLWLCFAPACSIESSSPLSLLYSLSTLKPSSIPSKEPSSIPSSAPSEQVRWYCSFDVYARHLSCFIFIGTHPFFVLYPSAIKHPLEGT